MSNKNDDVRVQSPTAWNIPLDRPYLDSCYNMPNGFDGNDDAFVNSDWGLEIESSTPEAQKTDHNQSESNEASLVGRRGNTKRKQPYAEGKSKKKPTPSASSQPPKPKTEDFKKIIEEKSVPGGLKVVSDALKRRKMIDKLAYCEAFMRSNQMQLPTWPDVKDIEIKINEIKSDYKKVAAKSSYTTTMEEAELKRRLVEVREDLEKLKKQEQRLVEVREDLEKLKKQKRKYSIKEKNLEPVFANNEGFSDEALRKELSSALPGIVLEETATKGPATAVKDKESLVTREQLRATFYNLKDELYAMDNDKVDVSDFQGLEEALEKTRGGKTPDHLELIALGIEKSRGKATEFSHKGIQVLVCAAIQEMLNVPIENWNWGMLKKWGATLHKANMLGFRVEFAEKLLKNSLFAYLGHGNVG